MKRQISQVVKCGEIVCIDLQRSAKLGLRGAQMAFTLQSDPKPAVYACVRRTLRQHGTELLLGGARLIML